MSKVIASNIPSSISSDKIKEFFSFCGTIDNIQSLLNNGEFKRVEITFASEKAVETALLLNDAEFGGSFIQVDPVHPISTPSSVAQTPSVSRSGDNLEDVPQEEKPKYAIMAQLLSEGYLLSDKIIAKAIEVDKQRGISTQFRDFVVDLDKKYVHFHDPESTASKNLKLAQDQAQGLYESKLKHYLVAAANHPLGVKIHDFYKGVSSDVLDVHAEAKRLKELKKVNGGLLSASGGTSAAEPAPAASTTTAPPAYPLDEKK
ncbi:Protein vip1 [Spathaspora sp. JA1]|nr:Protein vip1 [Spathaspora sp. JA1]